MKWFAWLFLGLLAFFSISANWSAPYDGTEEFRTKPHHPPVTLHWVDQDGKFHWRPFVYASEMRFDENQARYYEENSSVRYPVQFNRGRWFSVDAPAHIFLLGTDSRGRDLFSRILYGARTSLSIGLLGAFLSTFLGLIVGCLAGYFGGWIDNVLMRLAEFFIMIPGFYFLLALRGALPADLDSTQVYLLTIVVLSFIGWGGVARVIRGLVLSIVKNDFVTAAKTLGCSHFSVLLRHVIPHTLPYLTIILSISVPSFVLAESALSLLGLGIQDPGISWGALLTESLSVAHLQMHPWVILPGFVLALTAFSFNLLGDSYKSEMSFS